MEFLGETEPTAINDVLATLMGGMAIGEMTHRLSHTMLDDRERDITRFLREAAALSLSILIKCAAAPPPPLFRHNKNKPSLHYFAISALQFAFFFVPLHTF